MPTTPRQLRSVYNSDCLLCPLSQPGDGRTRLHTVCMHGDGTVEADLLVVGEAPGAKEDLDSKPFVGPVGVILRSHLQYHNLLAHSFLTNAVKCRPRPEGSPTLKHSMACKPYLACEISCLKPDVILAVGRVAINVLMGEGYRRGMVVGSATFEAVIIATWHPGFLIRQASNLVTQEFVSDLLLAKNLLSSGMAALYRERKLRKAMHDVLLDRDSLEKEVVSSD